MRFRPSRKYIGAATALVVVVFVTNPELYALSVLIGSIGFDVFLLFLSFQFKDQLNFLWSLIVRRR